MVQKIVKSRKSIKKVDGRNKLQQEHRKRKRKKEYNKEKEERSSRIEKLYTVNLDRLDSLL